MNFKMIGSVLGIVGFTTSCAFGPDYKRPETRMPANFSSTETAAEKINIKWWQQFGDPTLEQLIKTALEHNLDLEVALARVDEARARLGIAKSEFFPTLDLRGLAGTEKISETGPTLLIPDTDSDTDFFSLGVVLSYEIDFWGKIRRSNEAARAQLLREDFNRSNVQLTLISQVVSAYFALRSLDLQHNIAKNTVESRKGSYDLINKRFKGGVGNELNARQAEAEMHSAQTSVSKLEDQVSKAESFLSVLIGRDPRAIIESPIARGLRLDEIASPPTLPTLLPSSLLERRPDIAAAEQNLISANAYIGAAKAYYFPTISLTGGFGFESSDLKNLFKGESQVYSYGAGISMPIFNGGRTGYMVEAATARQKAALAQYRQAIQNAFMEVRNSLKTYKSYGDVVDSQKLQVTAVERNLYLANLRYKNGQSPYLEVLDAERQLFDVQLDLVRSQQSRLVAVVDLYKALGGGWERPQENSTKKN
ncbi:efflux transporter outer membrane subunit [Bdellovibrio sp. HCB274]|uniref:efflux transporter outer membrane subunit n=1 Tax=Bdellovibrio sp. HCB274 TaxID=3394361 RepID=UPI0039B62C58